MHAAAAAVTIVAVLAFGGQDDEPSRLDLHAVPVTERVLAAPAIGGLEDGSVLTIRVDGGPDGTRGHVQQCRRTATGFRGCTHRFPVLFDNDGVAYFQYQVDDLGECGAAGSCVVLVRDDDRQREAYAFTIFGAAAPPRPVVTTSPSGPYAEGDEVRVDVANLIPGSPFEAAFCAETCASPRRATAGADGAATTVVVIGSRCADCGIVVVAAAASSFTETPFVAPPTADYDPSRLIGGLVAASAFLLLAWWIIATVDWRPPSEAQTPELDAYEVS